MAQSSPQSPNRAATPAYGMPQRQGTVEGLDGGLAPAVAPANGRPSASQAFPSTTANKPASVLRTRPCSHCGKNIGHASKSCKFCKQPTRRGRGLGPKPDTRLAVRKAGAAIRLSSKFESRLESSARHLFAVTPVPVPPGGVAVEPPPTSRPDTLHRGLETAVARGAKSVSVQQPFAKLVIPTGTCLVLVGRTCIVVGQRRGACCTPASRCRLLGDLERSQE